MTSIPGRELRSERVLHATPHRVWQVLTDFSRMPDWSPELVRMVPLKRGGLRPGQWYLGINRRGAVVWPTRSVVATVLPAREVSWETRSSGATWVYRIEPEGPDATRVTLTRPMHGEKPALARWFARVLLGGEEEHDDELEVGMATTLERLAGAVETGS